MSAYLVFWVELEDKLMQEPPMPAVGAESPEGSLPLIVIERFRLVVL
jgi:hypothetical protein